MEELLQIMSEHFIWLVVGVCFVIGMVTKSVTQILATWSRERSRREIAAYVAEGSFSPDQGERLMKAEFGSTSTCGGS